MMANGRSDEDIINEDLQKFQSYLPQLQQNFQEQTNLLNKIQQEYTQFASKQVGNVKAKEEILNKLHTAIRLYSELKENLKYNKSIYFLIVLEKEFNSTPIFRKF